MENKMDKEKGLDILDFIFLEDAEKETSTETTTETLKKKEILVDFLIGGLPPSEWNKENDLI